MLINDVLSEQEKLMDDAVFDLPSKWITLVSLCIILFVCNSNSILLGLVVSFFPDLSPVETNALVGCPLLVTAVLSIPSSMSAKKFGARFVVSGLALVEGAALFALACVVRFSASSFVAVLCCGSLLGCGGAILNSGSVAIMRRFEERTHGLALGLFFLAYGLGPPVLGAYAATVSIAIGLWQLMLILGAMCVLAAILGVLLVRDPPPVNRRETDGGPSNVFAPLCSLDSWAITVCSGLTLGVYVGLTVYYPTLLLASFGTSPEMSGWVVFVSGVLSAFSCVGSGALADRTAPWVPSVVSALLGGAVLIGASFAPTFWSCVPLLICGAILVGAVSNVCIFRLVAELRAETIDFTIGMMETFGSLLAFLLPLTFLAFEKQQKYVSIFLAGLSFIAAIIVLIKLRKTKSVEE